MSLSIYLEEVDGVCYGVRAPTPSQCNIAETLKIIGDYNYDKARKSKREETEQRSD